MQNKIQILSTKCIDETLVSTASIYNICIDQASFIKTEEIIDAALQQRIIELSQQNATVVFTSANAVNAVSKFISTENSWKIFCIGRQTKELIADIFGQQNILGIADNAGQLAERIMEERYIKKIVFFSGCQRRDELPEKIKKHGIELEELAVYKTIQTPHVISKSYDGILFFSPSGVKSFFSVNRISDKTQIFVIGATTANEVKLFSQLPIKISEYPVVENLVYLAIKHFSNIKTF